MPKAQVAVVGGGIVGIAHAYEAARRGMSVVLFERTEHARGASIRNFGMIWPIGQPAGDRLKLALRSADLWRDLVTDAGLPVLSAGSIHTAYAKDEADVIDEFASIAPALGYSCASILPSEARSRVPALKDGLLSALWSDTEIVVDPRQVLRCLPAYLAEVFHVHLRFGAAVREISLPKVITARETWEVERVVICSGDDFSTLYPAILADSGLILCKLQMMRTVAQPSGWHLGAGVAGGLSLRFYPSFGICKSLERFRLRVAAGMPLYDRFGIHVMASETQSGAVTIGDSHEYGADISVFDKSEIERLILECLDGLLQLPRPQIAERWHGIYAKHPELPYYSATPDRDVRIVTGLGGAGMTLSFGVAEKTWNDW